MRFRRWEDLPAEMRLPEVRKYYDILWDKRGALIIKRLFDVAAALILSVLLSPLFLVLSVAVKLDSKGPVLYKQERVTQYGRHFRIHKFRTMVVDADKGSQVTVSGDHRVTRVGRVIRKYRLDETSQVIDVLQGSMSFVGTRPEVPKYVEQYTPEMMATLLMPAGITSEASICYKDEAELLDGAEDVDRVYMEQVLPEKMKWNLKGIESFGLGYELKLMIKTVAAMLTSFHTNKESS